MKILYSAIIFAILFYDIVFAYTPPTGSPLADKVHPRLLVIKDGYNGFGFTVSDMRDRILTYYTSNGVFQSYIDDVDANYAISIARKGEADIKWDGMNMAFIALMDPEYLSNRSNLTFKYSKSQYEQLQKNTH